MAQPLKLEDILEAARRLPRKAQVELVEALLRDEPRAAGPAPLQMLPGLGETELRALAIAVVAPGRQRRMKMLLGRNARGEATQEEQRELDELLEEADRVALLKARAAYTLARIHRSDPAAA